jgi:hypothetical protein
VVDDAPACLGSIDHAHPEPLDCGFLGGADPRHSPSDLPDSASARSSVAVITVICWQADPCGSSPKKTRPCRCPARRTPESRSCPQRCHHISRGVDGGFTLRDSTGISQGSIASYDAVMATRPDYYIVTFDTDQRPYPWAWELRRRGKPMGVRIRESGYQSRAAAEFAGKRALAEFLEALAKEERRTR